MRLNTLIILIYLSLSLSASQIPMGQWRTHFAYSNVELISQSNDYTYAISNDGALYSIGKHDDNIKIYSKINGFNDDVIGQIKYCPKNNTLVIAYNNSNIDLLTDNDDIINIPDILNKNIGHSKKINDICFDKNIAYLATDFGIVAIDLRKQEIKDTYIIGANASYVALLNIDIDGDYIYAAAKNKILYANKNDNLLNYQNWKNLNIPSSSVADFAIAESKLYLVDENNKLWEYKNNIWNSILSDIKHINSDNNSLWCIDKYGKATNLSSSISISTLNAKNVYADTEDDNIIWHSDSRGIAKYFKDASSASYFIPTGPCDKNSWRIKYSDGRIYVVPGGRWTTEYARPGKVMIYENNSWLNIYNYQLAALSDYRVTDIVDIAINPNNKHHFFVASYGSGLLEFKQDKLVKHYTAHNSSIETVFPNTHPTSNDFNNYQRVDGLSFDKDGNLWLLNIGNSPIKYLKPNGEFEKLAHSPILHYETLQNIIIHKSHPDIKFVLVPRSTATSKTALFIFDDNGSPSVSDDQYKVYQNFIDQDGKTFAPVNFHSIAQDNDGSIWVGTSTGVAVIGSISLIFTDNMRVNRVKIPRNDGTGLADYLLATEKINDIAVDGANRKWFATENSGVYLTSSDGTETIHHFTKENSPLLSNNVQCIGINDRSGEVFFGTANGMISFQSDATEAGKDFNNVHAFPNPVKPEYDGPISITGLMDESLVRITDVNGFVVYETISNGGIATWNGKLKDGSRAATGIYVVMCVDKSGQKNATTKILFIN